MAGALKRGSIAGAALMAPQAAVAASGDSPDLAGAWVGFASPAVFAAAYALVISEEATNLRKSKPMVVAAGILCIMIGVVHSGLGGRTKPSPPFAVCFSNTPSLCCF